MIRRLRSSFSIRLSVIYNRFAVGLCLIAIPSLALACPFCTAVKPTLGQQIESAEMAFLGDCTAVRPITSVPRCDFHVRKILSGKEQLSGQATVEIPTMTAEVGSLALLLGRRDQPGVEPDWRCVGVTEVGFAYIGKLPDMRRPVEQRLKYFAKFLENADPLIAEDAFLEFGHAPYDEVMQAGKLLSAAKLRQWMIDPKVPPERKGFYGLALGLTAQGAEREANIALLEKLGEPDAEAGGDFRAGFDGVLGGYLVAGGGAALDHITQRILDNPKAEEGDVRHAQTALRFYYEFGPKENRAAVIAAVEKLLDRPSTAAAAIIDLGRWQRWAALHRIAPLYNRQPFADPVTQRAVVGYLLACPGAEAADALSKLRERDPRGVAAAEKTLEALGGKN